MDDNRTVTQVVKEETILLMHGGIVVTVDTDFLTFDEVLRTCRSKREDFIPVITVQYGETMVNVNDIVLYYGLSTTYNEPISAKE